MATDPLDIAYIALGAKQALATTRPSNGVGPFEGELAYIRACIEHVELLDQAWEACSDTFPGVWCYEVAETFGHQIGNHLLRGGDPVTAQDILSGIVLTAIGDPLP